MMKEHISQINIISLIEDPEILIASGKRVFSKEETGALFSLQQTLHRFRDLQESFEEKVVHAEELACKRGRREGLEEGRQHAREELASKFLELEQQNEIYRKSLRKDVATLALKVVRKIASGVASDDLLAALATEAAAEHLPRQPVSLKVHPEYVEAVKLRLESFKKPDSAAVIQHVSADSELCLTDCILETPDGQVCADLETQLRAIEHHLLANEVVGATSVAAG